MIINAELKGFGDARQGFLSALRMWALERRKCINVSEPQGSQLRSCSPPSTDSRTISSSPDCNPTTMCLQLHHQPSVLERCRPSNQVGVLLDVPVREPPCALSFWPQLLKWLRGHTCLGPCYAIRVWNGGKWSCEKVLSRSAFTHCDVRSGKHWAWIAAADCLGGINKTVMTWKDLQRLPMCSSRASVFTISKSNLMTAAACIWVVTQT